MLFNSITFIAFFLLVFFINSRLGFRNQNRFLLVASYVFYGWWDYRFLALILFSTIVDYFCANAISRHTESLKRKRILQISILVNIGCLAFFKYFNFFADSLIDLFGIFGFQPDAFTLNIILPVGISFYTFQSLSYTIDVYRKKLEPASNFTNFALYVSFFPQLVAGPIERATTLMPQIQRARSITGADVFAGLCLISVGFLKKLVIADRCGPLVNSAFGGSIIGGSGAETWAFLYLFAFQIYGDFSGYSDIARGVSKLLGFELMKNFGRPYFVADPSAFWRHWHISLSTWIRDYIYIPLGGNGNGLAMTFRNLLITMFLGGLWHGAGWAYAIWGIYHGLLLIAYRLVTAFVPKTLYASPRPYVNKLQLLIGTIIFFHFTCVGWLIFRTGSLGVEFSQLNFLVTSTPLFFSPPNMELISPLYRLLGVMFVLVALLQWIGSDLEEIATQRPALGIAIMVTSWCLIATIGVFNGAEFIYFQF